LIGRQATFHGVYPKGEKLVKIGVKGRKAQGLPEQIPIKGFEMAQVKNYPVAFRDRAVVKCCGTDNLEKFLAPNACRLEA
jgi:hypothetical protein